MINSNSSLSRLLSVALTGCLDDLKELKRHLGFTREEAQKVLDTERKIENGKITILQRDHSILAIVAAKASVLEGFDELKRDDVELATAKTLLAQRLLLQAAGNCLGLQLAQAIDAEKRALVKLSTKALDSLHAENRAMKADVFAWCDQHMQSFKSMDDAALSIAGKLVPLKFRAVRGYMTEWRRQRKT